jgi:predicted phage terminase large subunit-like protein
MPSILSRAAYKGRNPALEAIHHARRAEAATPIETFNLNQWAEALHENLSPPQRQVYGDSARFKYLMAGRRFGKTFLALTRLNSWAATSPNGLFYYVTATYRMAKQIAWVDLKRMVPQEALASKNEQELSIELINGARIFLKGAEDPDRLRGVSLSGCVIDEAAYVRQDAWTMVLRPALSDQQGPAWFITTPAGENWFTDALRDAETGEDPEGSGFRFTTAEGGRVADSEIEAARRTLGPDLFRQEYGAEIVDLRGQAIFRREWFNYYKPGSIAEAPRIICSVDSNFKDGEKNDFVGITVWGCMSGNMYLLAIENQKIGFVDTLALIRSLWNRWRFRELLVEDKANGSAIIDQLKRETSGYSIHACNPLGGKEARGHAAAPSYEQGLVLHPADQHPRLRLLEEQLLSLGVRKDGNDDLADSVTQAVCYVNSSGPMTFSTVSWGCGTNPPPIDENQLRQQGWSESAIIAAKNGQFRR